MICNSTNQECLSPFVATFFYHGFLPQSPVRCHGRLLFLPPYHAVFPQWHSPTANPWRFCNLEIPPHPAVKTSSEPLEDSTVPNLYLISTQNFKAGYQGLWDSFPPFLSNFEHYFLRECRQVAGESSKRASALSSYRNLWIMCSYLSGCSATPGFLKIWKISGCLALQVACEFLEAHLPCIEYSERTSITSGQIPGD